MMDTFKPSIVFIDPDSYVLGSLASQFHATHHVHTLQTADTLWQLLESQTIHVVVSAQRLTTDSVKDAGYDTDNHNTGLSLLREVRDVSPNTSRILLTEYADLTHIVGMLDDDDIYRYLTKPWQPTELARTVDHATKLALENQMSRSDVFQALVQPTEKILVIDDCEETYSLLSSQFSNAYDVFWASNIDKVVEHIDQHEFGVIISEVKLNGVNISPLLESFKSRIPSTQTVLLTRFQDAEQLVTLIQNGSIHRCIPKPTRASLLEMSVQRAFSEHRALKSAEQQKLQATTTEPLINLSVAAPQLQSGNSGKKQLGSLTTDSLDSHPIKP